MGAPRLVVENLGCDRGGAAVVRGINLDLRAGEAAQIFGRNGAGKSSLLNVFAGLTKPVEGRMAWTSKDSESAPHPPVGSVLFLGHRIPVKPGLTVGENLAFWMRLYRADKTEAASALSRVGLKGMADVQAANLSAGQKKRLDFARALISRRTVWFLDEPTASIDDEGRTFVTETLCQHLSKGCMAIIATHERLQIPSNDLHIA